MKMPSLAPVSISTDCAGCQPSFVSDIIKEERERGGGSERERDFIQ